MTSGGFGSLLSKKLFWICGPQLIGMFLGGFVLIFLIASTLAPRSSKVAVTQEQAQQTTQTQAVPNNTQTQPQVQDNTTSTQAASSNIGSLLGGMQGQKGVSEIQALLATGNVNALDHEGRTAIMWASRYGYTAVVRELINSGANVSMGDVDGNTALMRASYNNHTEVVRLLISSGVDINFRDDDGMTALGLAHKHKRPDVINILNAAGAIQ